MCVCVQPVREVFDPQFDVCVWWRQFSATVWALLSAGVQVLILCRLSVGIVITNPMAAYCVALVFALRALW